jgi:DNA-nicking Smr family endonuclease
MSRQTSDDRLQHLSKPGAVPKSSRAVDGSTSRKLRQGKMTIEGRLDLHGYTQTAGRTAFRRFIEGAARAGKRCVLVITGKGAVGRDGPELVPWGHDDGRGPRGVLRQAIKIWADEAPMNHLILKMTPATPKDGGTGAFYVYLRRDRNFPDT